MLENDNLEQGEQLAPDEQREFEAEIDKILLESGEAANEPEYGQELARVSTSDALMGLVSPAFDILAPNWGVSMNEKKALAEAYANVIDKYFPDGDFTKWGAEIAAIGVTITIFQARIGTPRKVEKVKREDKAANDDQMGEFNIAS